jgi:hypothetical protein
MNVESYFQSLKDRVRNFIDDAHWLTDGEWKESVLRSILARRLPDTIKIGRGFVLTREGPTTQCDILIYKASSPILFREGELVFLTPDAVLGIIEVKARTSKSILEATLDRFSEIGRKMGRDRSNCFFGLFSYESTIANDQVILDVLREKCDHEAKIVELISLGCSTFVRWWKYHPDGNNSHYERWHSYRLDHMSAGYFVANVVDFVSPGSVGNNDWLWFPEVGKESKKTGDAAFGHALNS